MPTLRQKTFPISKEQSYRFQASENGDDRNQGNGGDRHIPLGTTSGGDIYRAAVRAGIDWTGVYQIVDARLVFTTMTEDHVSFGANPTISARRNSADFVMRGGGESNWQHDLMADARYPGSTTTGTTYSRVGVATRERMAYVDITPIVELWAPDTVYKSDGVTPGGAQPNYGVRLLGGDDEATGKRYELYGMRAVAGKVPYLLLNYYSNIPPNVPIVTAPETGGTPTVVPSLDAATLTVEFYFSDNDAGDTCQRVELETYGAGATDGAPGTRLATTGAIAPTPLGPLNAFSVTLTGLTPRTNQRYRLRVQDSDGAWGHTEDSPLGWTPLDEGLILPAYRIGAPLQSYMESGLDSPLIAGSLNSQDPDDFITGWEGEFYRDTPAGAVNLWPSSGMQDIGGISTRSEVAYGGSTLNGGDMVRWRHRHRNRDGQVGDWSGWMTTTVYAATGPSAMSPISTTTKLLTQTPVLTIADSAPFDTYAWRLYRGGALIYDSGEVTLSSTSTVPVTVPAGLLTWGDGSEVPLEWDAAVRRTGLTVLGEYSPLRPIRINSLPSTTLSVTGRSSSGYVANNNPVYVAPYSDPDRFTYAEWPAAKEWEIRQAATPQGTGSLVKHVTDLTPVESEQLGATFVPTADQGYDIRVRYRDDATPKLTTTMSGGTSAGATVVPLTALTALVAGDWLTLEPGTADEETRQIMTVGASTVEVDHGYTLAHSNADAVKVFYWGPWTPWLLLTYSAPPTVGASLPADASSVVDPTRTLTWTYSGARSQDFALISIYERISSVDELIWQEIQDGNGVSWDIPAFLLQTGRTYAWEVTGYDTVGLSGTTTRRTFTTSFSAPAELTGLTATSSQEDSAVVVAWTASTDPYLHHYRVWWRTGDSEWVRADAGPIDLGDGRAPLVAASFSHYGARLGLNEYRVEVHNGAQASEGASVTGSLEPARAGSWMLVEVTGDQPAQALNPTNAPRILNTTTEVYRPPGRGSAVLLNWGSSGRSVSLTCTYVPADDGNVTAAVERLYAAGAKAWLKAPAPYVMEPILGMPTGVTDEPLEDGFVSLQINLEEVEG